MAINLELVINPGYGRQPGSRAPAKVFPADSITNISAAGETTLTNTEGKVFTLRNRAGGDSVYALIRAVGNTAAAVGNAMLLAAGQEFDFMLPKGGSATYELDVRAIA